MIVTQDNAGIRTAALELMVESLREEDTNRQLDNLLMQDPSPETVAKLMPARKLADGFYPYASYLMWLRGMIASNIDVSIYADEAEGLREIETAAQQFAREHPACPRCETRQYSKTPISCRKCGMSFRKK